MGAVKVDHDPLIGTRVGSFTVVRQLGRGGMGTVYLAEHASIGSRVALKVLHAHLAADENLVARFWSEARAVNLVAHEHIVNVFDMYTVPPNRCCLAMEYLEGQTLEALCGEPMAPQRAVRILAQVLDALSAAHACGIVHRDLKAENVFLTRRGGREDFVKLLDFGIAKLLMTDRSGQTSAHMVLGTPNYMAPEQITGEPIDGRADLYAVGVLAYLLLAGRLPFEGRSITDVMLAHRSDPPPPLSELAPTVPAELCAAVMTALAKRPEDRFETAHDMKAALERALLGPKLSPASVREPRHPASHPCTVYLAENRSIDARLGDLSRGGAFIASPVTPPPLFTALRVGIHVSGRTLELEAEVVRHVTPEQAGAWQMERGFGVQFTQLSSDQRDGIGRILAGLPLDESAAHGAAAELLGELARRSATDPYALLDVPLDADVDEVRKAARRLKVTFASLRKVELSQAQRGQIDRALTRLDEAVSTLGAPSARAEYDAARGNFRGVARCLAAGLTVTELESLRTRYLQSRPALLGRAHVHSLSADGWERQREHGRAAEELEKALALDPLNLELQKRYWSLRRSMDARARSTANAR